MAAIGSIILSIVSPEVIFSLMNVAKLSRIFEGCMPLFSFLVHLHLLLYFDLTEPFCFLSQKACTLSTYFSIPHLLHFN